MKTVKEIFNCLLIVGIVFAGVYIADKHGSANKPFLVYDAQLKKDVYVTESNIREHFELSKDSSNCNIMGICVTKNKTFLDPKKYGG